MEMFRDVLDKADPERGMLKYKDVCLMIKNGIL